MLKLGSPESDAEILDLVGHPIAIIRIEGRPAARLNPAACRLFEIAYMPGAMTPLAAAIGERASAALALFAKELPIHGVGAVVTLECRTRRGEKSVSFEITRGPAGASGFVAALREERADNAAADALASAHAVLQTLPVGVEIYDRDFNALFYNRKSDELFDYAEGAVAHHDAWWRHAFPDHRARKRAHAQWRKTTQAAREDPSRAHMVEWAVRCSDGDTRAIQFYYRCLEGRFSLVLWDVTEQRRLESELRTGAETDSLTGIANRRRFFQRADEAIALADQRGEPFALLMLDIDHFKSINDRHGHGAGDEVLKAVAARAGAMLRRDDMIARLGGEEFAALLPRTNEQNASLVAKRLRRAIAAPLLVGDVVLRVTASVGGATRRAGEGAEDLLERADRALYAAKSGGRDRLNFVGAL